MALHVNFHDQLDFNHNGTYDAGTEKLLWEGPLVNDAFKGVSEDGFSTWSSDAKAITVIQRTPITNLYLNVQDKTLEWQANTNETYSLLTTTNLTDNSWQPLTNNIPGTNGMIKVNVDFNDMERFYKGLIE